MFLEDLATVVLWLLALVVGLNLVFFLFILFRRFARQRFFIQKDAARERFKSTIDRFVDGTLSIEEAAAVLSLGTSEAEREAIYQLASRADHSKSEQIARLLYSLGFVDRWARQAFGKKLAKFLVEQSLKKVAVLPVETGAKDQLRSLKALRLFGVSRAIAVAHLGKLAPHYAQPFLAKALEDCSPEVRRVAVVSLGRNRSPQAVPLLVRELMRAIEQGNDVSLRTMKSALIRYRLEDLGVFIEHIRHSSRRARFFVIDSIRQICERASAAGRLGKNDFPPELYELLLTECANDEFEDVRARTAAIIRYFRDDRSIAVLRKLLRDENEFVRLHAVRACADPFFTDMIADVIARATDTKWRVREAAVGALNRMGPRGREELYKFFIECGDRFASEQISEELQRMGVLSELVVNIAEGGDVGLLAQSVADKLVAMGKTSVLLSTMATSDSSPACIALIEALSAQPHEEYMDLLEHFAANRTGHVQAKAKQILRRLRGLSSGSNISAAAAGGPNA